MLTDFSMLAILKQLLGFPVSHVWINTLKELESEGKVKGGVDQKVLL